MSQQDTQTGQTESGLADQLALYKTYLAAAKVRLFKSTLAPTPNTLVAAFIAAEADFTGYVAGVPTYTALSKNADGQYTFGSSRVFFQATDAVSPNVIGGYWFESAGGVLQGYGVFDPPINMATALAFLAMTLEISAVPAGGTAAVDY